MIIIDSGLVWTAL